MGTGDCICICMTGGAPWGFRLQGGKGQEQPLQVAKIRSQSKASGAGLREGDEVVSINGSPCADLTYPQVIQLMERVTDSLQVLVKRPSSGRNDTLLPETENKSDEHLPREGSVETTPLQLRPATECQHRESCVTPGKSAAPRAGDRGSGPGFSGSKEEETGLSDQVAAHVPAVQRRHLTEEVILREKAEEGWPSPVVELQLSLSQEGRGTGAPVVALLGAGKSKSPDPDPSLHHSGVVPINSVPASEKGDPSLRSSKIIQLSGGQELRVLQAQGARDAGLPRVEVILDCADRQRTEGCRLQAGNGGVEAPGEGGQSEAPPSLVCFAVSSEGTEQGEDPGWEPDRSRPHKHRARHARLRRSESLSEKQVKEAKSKCKSIALLLTDAPSPHSRGVLMFKRRRRRARKFTLVSYGTGQLWRREDPGDQEDGDWDDPCEAALLGASESDADEALLSDADDRALAVSFDWDSGLVDIEKKLSRGDTMEMLPDTSGKGALMFARRRERMEQIAAQREEGAAGTARPDGPGASFPAVGPAPGAASGAHVEASRGAGHAPRQNGLGAAPANRTARPFPGPGGRPAAPFSPPRSGPGPAADFPAPPPYSAVTPPPGAVAAAASSPVGAPAPPPPWPQPAPWAPPASYDASERLASRDERIAVPAKRTGILQEAKRRSTTKPMFTFKEPKVSPNPELLSLLQNAEGRRGAGAGGDSGPEEDYLSLGAEACNFMQGAAKQKTPPPVAPKPAARASSQPATPVAPVWSPGGAPAQPPVFPACGPPPGAGGSSIKIAPPSCAPARPASALHLAGPFKGPQAAVAGPNSAAKPTAPAAAAAAAGPPDELPGMRGKGAQLFAKRQSRMEKYVVDSDTVQAHAARAQSPTPSLPAAWKYSAHVRAPPPVAYNPIHSPSYPPAAVRAQPAAPQAPKASKKKGKKPLNALDVMKHQPYQLNASLFTFQPPEARAPLPQKSPAKPGAGPAAKPALPPRAAPAGSPPSARAASVYSVPAYSSPPACLAEAASPASASPVPGGAPGSPKPESASASYFVAPRPKFSAKKSGIAVQGSGRSLSLPGRPRLPTVSATPAWSCAPRPADGLETAYTGVSPRGAAARSPPGLGDSPFTPRSIQQCIVANVVSAARRKVLPGPSERWPETLSRAPGAHEAGVGTWGGPERGAGSLADDSVLPRARRGAQPPPSACDRRPSRHDSEIMSDDCPPVADCSYNPQPRGWRRPT